MNERTLYIAKLHWKIGIPALLIAPVGVIVGMNIPGAGALLLIPIVLWLLAITDAWLRWYVGELRITTERVFTTFGIIERDQKEFYLEQIRSVEIFQSLTGKIFGYGTVRIVSAGKGKEFKNIADPMDFAKALKQATMP